MPHPVDPVSVQFRSDDGSLTPDNALFRWGLAMEDAMGKSGRVRPSAEQLKARLEKAGFADVQTFTVKQPLGPWAKAKYGFLNCRGVGSHTRAVHTAESEPNYYKAKQVEIKIKVN
jgi:hypothetical protein